MARSGTHDDALRRLRAALDGLAASEVDAVLDAAAAGARERARKLIEDQLVDAIVAQASERLRAERTSAAPAGETAAPAAAAETGTGWWVYGVIAADETASLPPELAGVEPGTSVELVGDGELSALASPVPLSEYGDERLRDHLNDLAWVERTARAHEAVLDQALAAATVVPLRLCTIYRDRARVERLLADERVDLGDALARLRGRAEWGLKLFVDRPRLTDAVREHAGDAAGDEAGAAEYLQRKRRERDLRERVDRMVITCAQESYARLERLAAGARTNPVQHPEAHGRVAEMALNAVYLVDAESRDAVAAAVDDLRAEYEPLGFELELTGPWPAYNFASPTPAPAP
jgi:hypothetical protein